MTLPELSPRQVAALVALTGVFFFGLGMTTGVVLHDRTQPDPAAPTVTPAQSSTAAVTDTAPRTTPPPIDPAGGTMDVTVTGPTVQPSPPAATETKPSEPASPSTSVGAAPSSSPTASTTPTPSPTATSSS